MTESNIEKIYKLSPIQEGMLFHKLLNDDSTEYTFQMVFQYKNGLNIEKMRQSLSLLSLKHEVLRTAISITKTGTPLQVILRDRQIEINEMQAKDEVEIKTIQRADVSRGFDLKEDSLLRMTVIQTSDKESNILWTMHHIITDGWCLSLLFGDFLENYEKLLADQDYETLKHEVEKEKSKVGSYSEYIGILEQKDKGTGLRYWERLLEGYSEAAVIVPMQTEETGNEVGWLELKIDKELSVKLQSFAQKERITMNNITEMVWGIILQKYNNTNDVVFGKVVSGRDVAIKGIESIVGLFINTVPIRVKNDEDSTIRELLQFVHKQGVESSEYDYCSLAEVQSKSELGRHLFNTIFVFENYYVNDRISGEIGSQHLDGNIVALNGREQTNYGLSVSAYYSDCLY
jgi:NRPS condensation-like uncharacterized protein